MSTPAGVKITLPTPQGAEKILTPDAIQFLAVLHRTFDKTRRQLLANREKVQAELDKVSLGVVAWLQPHWHCLESPY